jgi:hypothetical protein
MDTRTDNAQSKLEQAEGSTENVNPEAKNRNVSTPNPAELGRDIPHPMEHGPGQESHPEKPAPTRGGRDAGGISNRPLQEERENQQELPQRGEEKGE